jgi:hypothetical protein
MELGQDRNDEDSEGGSEELGPWSTQSQHRVGDYSQINKAFAERDVEQPGSSSSAGSGSLFSTQTSVVNTDLWSPRGAQKTAERLKKLLMKSSSNGAEMNQMITCPRSVCPQSLFIFSPLFETAARTADTGAKMGPTCHEFMCLAKYVPV